MNDIPERAFWMVYGVGQREPTYRHPTKEDASKEAGRLAREHPGVVFVVLESVMAVVKNDLFVRRYRGGAILDLPHDPDDDIPF